MMVTEHEDGTFSLDGRFTRDQLTALGAVADFPLWTAQPEPVADTCAALLKAVRSAVPVSAEAFGMVPVTTVK